MKKLNEYLVQNYPAIWNSRIIYILGFAFFTSVFFFLFGDIMDTDKLSDRPANERQGFYDKDYSYTGNAATMLWSAILIAWLYFQYHYKPFVRKYSLWEVFKGSLLNFLCIVLILTPLFLLFFEIIEGRRLDRVVEEIISLSYIFCLPIIFLPFIIKSYSFSEIVLVIMGLIIYTIINVFVQEAIRFDSDYLYIIAAVNYLIVLIYIIIKLTIRRYNQIDKSLIFLLIGLVPWFISALIEPVFRASDRDSFNPIPDTGFNQNPEMYFAAFVLSFLFLVVLTWYVTKSLKKPMVIK